MRDFRPLLQIVHVSDLHVVSPEFTRWDAARRLLRLARESSPEAYATLAPGLIAHDPHSAEPFARFLEAIAVSDPIWRKLPTWLVDSGDLTTFGDEASLRLGREYLRRFAAAASARARLGMHGNHDFVRSEPRIVSADGHRDASDEDAFIRWFPVRWPTLPWSERAPGGRIEVQLYGLDSNEWHAPGGELAAGSRRRLASLVDAFAPPDEARALRIVVTHHPPPADSVRRSAHLVLCGHRHELVPPLGDLANTRTLGVGSLMQRATHRTGAHALNQHCAVIRVYHSPSRPHTALIERLVATRAGSIGPYRFVPIPGSTEIAEEFTIDV